MLSTFKGYSLSINGNDFISPHFQVKEFARPGMNDVIISLELVDKLELLSDCINNKAIYIKKTYSHSRVTVSAKNYNAADLAVLAQACGFGYIRPIGKTILDLSIDPALESDDDYVFGCDWIHIREIPWSWIDHIRLMETREPFKTTVAKFDDYDLATNGTFFCTHKEPQFHLKINGLTLHTYPDHKWGMIFTKDRMRYGELSQGNTFVSGHPILLDNGRFCEYKYASEIDGERARTAYGYDDDYLYILVCEASKGLTLRGLRQVMSYIGAKYAINIDGGGSSALAENNGDIVVAGDGRKLNNAILIKFKDNI